MCFRCYSRLNTQFLAVRYSVNAEKSLKIFVQSYPTSSILSKLLSNIISQTSFRTLCSAIETDRVCYICTGLRIRWANRLLRFRIHLKRRNNNTETVNQINFLQIIFGRKPFCLFRLILSSAKIIRRRRVGVEGKNPRTLPPALV